MTQCPYYYHTWSNALARRCKLEEGHIGKHEEEQLLAPQAINNFSQPETGWRKH